MRIFFFFGRISQFALEYYLHFCLNRSSNEAVFLTVADDALLHRIIVKGYTCFKCACTPCSSLAINEYFLLNT